LLIMFKIPTKLSLDGSTKLSLKSLQPKKIFNLLLNNCKRFTLFWVFWESQQLFYISRIYLSLILSTIFLYLIILD